MVGIKNLLLITILAKFEGLVIEQSPIKTLALIADTDDCQSGWPHVDSYGNNTTIDVGFAVE